MRILHFEADAMRVLDTVQYLPFHRDDDSDAWTDISDQLTPPNSVSGDGLSNSEQLEETDNFGTTALSTAPWTRQIPTSTENEPSPIAEPSWLGDRLHDSQYRPSLSAVGVRASLMVSTQRGAGSENLPTVLSLDGSYR